MATQEVSVDLATNVLDVSGTVNGTAYTWVRDGDTWTATVEAADDGKYVVALSITDTLGITTEQSVILYYGLNLVRDRTAADVARVRYLLTRLAAGEATEQERAEFLEPTMKGAYNYTDLNRVGAAISYMQDRLYTICGKVIYVTAKRDWTESDIPTLSDMATYLHDVSEVRGALNVPEGTPPVPDDMDRLTHGEANDIEQIIWVVNELVMLIMLSWRYAGEYYAGEV